MLNNVKKRRLMPLFFVYMKNRIKFVVNKNAVYEIHGK